MKNILDLWSSLDVRHLAAFRLVAATGSIARAAQELGYTQPAISHQLATLERAVGHRLFDRGSGRRNATLTAAGRVFAGHVEAFESQLASAHADLEALSAGERGIVRVGAFQSVSARILPPIVRKLAAGTERVSLELTETTEERDLLPALAMGSLDFAFVLLPLEDERLEVVELLSDPYYLVAPVDGRYRVELETLRDLQDVPVVAPRTCRSWAAVADQIAAAGVTIDYAFRTDDNLAIKGLVQSGTGVALLSRLSLEMIDEGLATAPLDHLLEPRRIGLAWARARSLLPHQELVVAVAREVCDAIAAEHRAALTEAA